VTIVPARKDELNWFSFIVAEIPTKEEKNEQIIITEVSGAIYYVYLQRQ